MNEQMQIPTVPNAKTPIARAAKRGLVGLGRTRAALVAIATTACLFTPQASAQIVDSARGVESAAPWDVSPQEAIAPNGFSDESRAILSACRADDAEACLELGRRFHGGREVPRDNEMAIRLFDWVCDAGEALGCVELGGRYYMGFDVPVDLTLARDYLERGCEGESADACLVVGRMYREGVGTERDREHASALFSRGCELGLRTACEEVHATANPGTHEASLVDSAPAAVREAARSCDRGVMARCHRLALAYREGEEIPVDATRADALDADACDWGYLPACAYAR